VKGLNLKSGDATKENQLDLTDLPVRTDDRSCVRHHHDRTDERFPIIQSLSEPVYLLGGEPGDTEKTFNMSVRRTWDKELYAQKAAARAELKSMEEQEDDFAADLEKIKKRKLDSGISVKEEFQAADAGAIGPAGSQRAFLKVRTTNLTEQLHADVGKTQVVTAQAMELGVGGGFWCETCACLLKDSSAYLSHINGKKHQRTLGFSMRVENIGIDAVKQRMQAVVANMEPQRSGPTRSNEGGPRSSSSSSVDGRGAQDSSSSSGSGSGSGSHALQALDDRQQQQQQQAADEVKRARKEAKRQKMLQQDEEDEGVDPEIAAMMGFGSFAKKK